MNAMKPEGNTHRSHGSVVPELKRTWSNSLRDLVLRVVVVSLVPEMFCELLQEKVTSIRVA